MEDVLAGTNKGGGGKLGAIPSQLPDAKRHKTDGQGSTDDEIEKVDFAGNKDNVVKDGDDMCPFEGGRRVILPQDVHSIVLMELQ